MQRSQDWLGPDSQIGVRVRSQSDAALGAYAINPLLVREHSSIERATTQGGYGRRQIFELVQNGADALQDAVGGRIAVVLTDQALYCANQGEPIDFDGVDAILSSHLNVKKANEIGRFGIGFKSVLAVSKEPEFYSRSGSFRFDRHAARERISAALGRELGEKEVPILRTAEPIHPLQVAEGDRVLRGLMDWATTVVRLPRLYGSAVWLSDDLSQFPPEFLLFSPHVGRLTLHDMTAGKPREILLELTPDGILLRADDRNDLWWIVDTKYVPSEYVREDGGVHAERENLPLSWAVPKQGRIVRGRFWAFFPTETQTTVSGILNGPWKTNEDRQNLLPGPFNEEFIETAAQLVVDNIPKLWTEADPARHLDLLPSRDSYNWADKLLGERVFSLCAGQPIVPDQDGRPRPGEDLRLHPDGIPQTALELWGSYSGRPRDWVHRDAETFNRRARVERLVPPEKVALHHEWLEALASDHTTEGSIAALRVAGWLVSEARAAVVREVHRAKIVLTDLGTLAAPDQVLIAVAGRQRNQASAYVSAALTGDPEAMRALQSLGVKESDPVTDLTAHLSSIVAGNDGHWLIFWDLATRVPAHRLASIVERLGWYQGDLKVMTLSGEWQPLRLTYLPGRVVPHDGSRDRAATVDVAAHQDSLEHIRALGALDGPVPMGGGSHERWVDAYKDNAKTRYVTSLRAKSNAKPRIDYVSVEEMREKIVFTGPLDPLEALSDEGRAAATHLAVGAGVAPDRVWVSHETAPARYKRAQLRGPIVWRLRREGRVRTSLGVVPVSRAVGPQLGDCGSLFPVAHLTASEAQSLALPASFAEVRDDVWTDALLRASESSEPRVLGAFVEALLDANRRPTKVRAQVGQDFAHLPAAEVTAVPDPERAPDLAAHGVPFVIVSTNPAAERLVSEFGMRSLEQAARFEPIATVVRDPVPLVDEFPSLRPYLPEEASGTLLARCVELSERIITGQGTTQAERTYLRTGTTIFWVQAGGDLELLLRLRDDLDLPVTEEDCERVASRKVGQEREKRLAAIRAIHDPAERLVAAVGVEGLRSRLPSPVVEAVRTLDDAAEGQALAKAALSLMGPTVLHEFRDQLNANGLEAPIQWAGSATARTYVRELGFAPEYAGSEHQRLDSLLEVDGPPDLPPLHSYQEQVTESIRSLLSRGNDRGLLSLPTGAGKTRVAVQALVEAMAQGRLASPVLWMAETEELCEQAVQAWAYVWRATGGRERLRISRLWSANEAEASRESKHVVVATVAKLQHCLEDEEYGWLANASCVVIDEAHGAIAPVYTRILSWLGISANQTARSLIGLTATPYRGTSETETARLVGRFYGRRLDEGVLGEDQYASLQEMGVLARVEHELLDGAELELTPGELAHLEQTRLMPTTATQRLAGNKARNDVLIASVRKQAPERTVLLFATSVEHAEVLAATLSAQGVPAAAISSRTPTAARRYFVDRFRRGDIRVLTNYAVLTEGFDAPAVGAVYVARPTYSPNLYQQMIGRGLRGPLNGGKDVCLIVNVRDNIAQYGEALAFKEFEYLWSGSGSGASA